MLALLMTAILATGSVAPEAPQPVTADYIQRLAPDIAPQKAQRLGASIRKWADHYGVDPILIAAILKQESDYRSGIKSCSIVLRYRRCEVTCDLGIAQVNQLWIEKWKLDAERLQRDDDYNIRIAARILAQLQKEFASGEPEDWYARYHSGTPSKKGIYLEKLEPLLAMR